MQDYTELKKLGWLTFGELAAEMARKRHMRLSRMKELLVGPLNKIRGNLFERGLAIEPDGRDKYYMYHPSLVLPLVAYVAWHQPGGRHSMAKAMTFVNRFIAGEESAQKYLPPRLRPLDEDGTTEVGGAQVICLKRTA